MSSSWRPIEGPPCDSTATLFWPWEAPAWEHKEANRDIFTATGKFRQLMRAMLQPNHTKFHEDFEIGCTYRSEFERRFQELPEELQKVIVAKIWQSGTNHVWESKSAMYPHHSFHYNQEYFLYEFYIDYHMQPAKRAQFLQCLKNLCNCGNVRST